MYSSIHDHRMTMAQADNQLTFKNNILCNLTRAIQSVQQYYVQKESALTNSDCQAHDLCQQFDNIFFYGLKRLNESYFKVVVEFTHKDVIQEINTLLNVTTNFGKARAWIYHSLNDNLMESYLKCFLENRKLLLRYYKKESLIIDEQIVTVLLTLVSGLENIQFKLFSDVPYLDHSCWPTHLYSKRDLIQQKLNILNQQDPRLDISNISANGNDLNNSKSSTIRKRVKGNRKPNINNVSLDSNSSTNFSDLYANDSENSNNDNMNRNRTKSDLTESIDNSNFTTLANRLNNTSINKSRVKESSSPSISSSEGIISSSATSSNFKNKEFNKSIEIDNEITKLREEAAANASRKSPSKQQHQVDNSIKKPSSLSISNSSNTPTPTHDIDNLIPFNKKIQDIENYSAIIENAASKMDCIVQNMTEVYQSYDENRFYIESPTHEASPNNSSINQTSPITFNKNDNEKSLYDIDVKLEEKMAYSMEKKMYNLTDSMHSDTLTSFDEKLKLDLKQEIKVDNNTKLMLIMNIFQNDQNEEFIKLYHVTRGHSQGEIEEIFLLLTSYAIYILLRNETNSVNLFKKEAIINHNEIDYIELSLNGQAFHVVCINRRKNYWFTTASRTLTDSILTDLEISRERSHLKLPLLSILREPTIQKIAIKKFIANNENISPQDFEIKSYSLVFWEDQASATSQIISKEGYLFYLLKSGSNFSGNSNNDWKKAYFVLKNDVLSQFRDQNEKRAHHIIKLNGDEFSGCRKSSNSTRQYTIELILSNSTTLYLAGKNELEASEWLQSFCKTISLGNHNTDVPVNSCLPCCSVITNKKIYYCHEDLNTNFYRLLDVINLQEIIKISYDQTCQYFCIIYVESENKKQKYWFVYFVDEVERNSFINSLKNTWEALFQIQFTVETLNNKELLKRCQNGLDIINNTWQNYSIKSD